MLSKAKSRLCVGYFVKLLCSFSYKLENGIVALLGYPGKPSKVLNHIYQTYDLIAWFLVTT
jgi:hypothetical protein